MKPFPLIASTIWWSVLTVAAFGYATYVAVTLVGSGEGGILEIGILPVLFFVSCSILWFLRSYWQGQEWTRDFVIIGLILKGVYYLYRLARVYHAPNGIGIVLFSLRIFDLLFSIYVFYWLWTKEARRYFTFQARTD
jgi:hypothetical protein